MSSAKVQSIEAVKSFRLAMIRFADAAGGALTDADAEMQKTLNWLETEQRSYWEGQIRKRTEAVAQAKLQVQIKKSCRNVDGTPGSAIEEEKALRLAIRRLAEAQEKLAHTRRSERRLQREILNYRGQVQRFATAVAVDVPLAIGRLDAMIGKLEAYVGLQPGEAGEEVVSEGSAIGEPGASMARPEPVEIERSSDDPQAKSRVEKPKDANPEG